MKIKASFGAVLGALCLAHASAFAHEVVYKADLKGASESPPSNSPGSGSATISIDLDLLTMHVQANFAGLDGNTTAAHIHCCTAEPFIGNASVATTLPSFPDFPLGVTGGTYDKTFDMSLASSYNPAFVTAHGGTVGTAFNALIAGLDAGEAYFNIHSSTFPGGEVRALLAPVPEPSTYGLALAGALGVGLWTRGRRQSA